MEFVQLQKHDGIATLTLARGKVNAINGPVVDQMREQLKSLEHDPEAKAIVLTGAGKFFSFGFDVPEFLSFEKPQFAQFLTALHRPPHLPLPLSQAGGGRPERPYHSRRLHAGPGL